MLVEFPDEKLINEIYVELQRSSWPDFHLKLAIKRIERCDAPVSSVERVTLPSQNEFTGSKRNVGNVLTSCAAISGSQSSAEIPEKNTPSTWMATFDDGR